MKITVKNRSDFSQYGWAVRCVGGVKIIFNDKLKALWARENIPQ